MLRNGTQLLRVERAITTLEHALILPLLFGFIIGVIDVTALVQSYAALREGVRLGVRCAATSDGPCVGIRPDSPVPLFHWYRLAAEPLYWINRVDYRGDVYSLERPTYRYLEARVLADAVYTLPARDYSAKRWVYPASRRLTYNVRTTNGAFVAGPAPTAPTFVFKNSRSESYPAEFIAATAFDTVLRANRRTVAVQVPFDVPVEQLPCFRSSDLDEGSQSAHQPTTAACSSSRVPAIVFIRGAARGHGHGELTLAITGRHISSSDFGGQQFDVASNGWSSRNFVPRGVTPGYVDAALADAPEFSLYAGRIEVERGESLGVTISIPPGSGAWTNPDIEYRLTEVRILPAIVASIEASAPCPSGVPRSEHLSGAPACAVAYPHAAWGQVAVDTSANLDLSPAARLDGMLSAEHAADTLAMRVAIPEDYIVSAGPARTLERSAPCPSGNRGVADLPNGAGLITAPETVSVCPIDDAEANRYHVTPLVSGWRERIAALPAAAAFEWTPETCADAGAPPPLLSEYPKPIREESWAPFFPPAPATPLDVSFACSDFRVRHEVLDDPAHGGTIALPEESLFLGIHPERSTACRADALREDAAQKGGIDPRALLITEEHSIDTVAESNAPADACAVFSTTLGAPSGRTLLTANGPLPRGMRPPECSNAPCTAEFASLDRPADDGVVIDTSSAASYWGFQEMSALNPRARWGCSGANCAQLAITEAADSIIGTGSMTVPLMAFGGRGVTLEYSDHMTKETALARPALAEPREVR